MSWWFHGFCFAMLASLLHCFYVQHRYLTNLCSFSETSQHENERLVKMWACPLWFVTKKLDSIYCQVANFSKLARYGKKYTCFPFIFSFNFSPQNWCSFIYYKVTITHHRFDKGGGVLGAPTSSSVQVWLGMCIRVIPPSLSIHHRCTIKSYIFSLVRPRLP